MAQHASAALPPFADGSGGVVQRRETARRPLRACMSPPTRLLRRAVYSASSAAGSAV